MKTIAFTFAGRRDRMSLQVAYMRKLLDRGVIDEWHVWSFARTVEDQQWLVQEFGHRITILGGPADVWLDTPFYKGGLTRLRPQGDEATLAIVLDKRLRLEARFTPAGAEMRKGMVGDLAPMQLIAGAPLQLGTGSPNEITIASQDQTIAIGLNGQLAFRIDAPGASMSALMTKAGPGTSAWNCGDEQAKTRLMMLAVSSAYDAFRRAYVHYSRAEYLDALFVKMDDDIVFCDLDHVQGFIDGAARSPGVQVWTANVVNNGVCAFYQAKKGWFGGLDIDFEYPVDGTGGTLWESGGKSAALHAYFASNSARILKKARAGEALTALPAVDRFSINFVAFKYPVMPLMCGAYSLDGGSMDDEHLMTVALPKHFGVEKFIYNRLTVAHLSFFPQENAMDVKAIVDLYAGLTATKPQTASV